MQFLHNVKNNSTYATQKILCCILLYTAFLLKNFRKFRYIVTTLYKPRETVYLDLKIGIIYVIEFFNNRKNFIFFYCTFLSLLLRGKEKEMYPKKEKIRIVSMPSVNKILWMLRVSPHFLASQTRATHSNNAQLYKLKGLLQNCYIWATFCIQNTFI